MTGCLSACVTLLLLVAARSEIGSIIRFVTLVCRSWWASPLAQFVRDLKRFATLDPTPSPARRSLDTEPADNYGGESSCSVSCAADGEAARVISSLPRVNLRLKPVSADLGSFSDVLDCDPASGTCSLHSISLSQLLPSGKDIDADSVISYVQVRWPPLNCFVTDWNTFSRLAGAISCSSAVDMCVNRQHSVPAFCCCACVCVLSVLLPLLGVFFTRV
jgi:hypothetical protein